MGTCNCMDSLEASAYCPVGLQQQGNHRITEHHQTPSRPIPASTQANTPSQLSPTNHTTCSLCLASASGCIPATLGVLPRSVDHPDSKYTGGLCRVVDACLMSQCYTVNMSRPKCEGTQHDPAAAANRQHTLVQSLIAPRVGMAQQAQSNGTPYPNILVRW